MGLFAKIDPQRMRDYSRNLWETYKVRYPFHATSPVRIDPSTLDSQLYGHFVGVVLEDGVRTWGFTTQKGRDLFVKRHDARAA